jgi:hypothetical protein
MYFKRFCSTITQYKKIVCVLAVHVLASNFDDGVLRQYDLV